MPAAMALEKRGRAIVAWSILTGIRDGAMVDLKLRDIDLADGSIRQDARDVRTKFSKTMSTWFFLVGEDIEAIFTEYVRYLREDQLWSPYDPLFPKTAMGVTADGGFTATGLERAHWAGAAALRNIVKAAFEAHGMPAYGPHSFRKTLTRLAQQVCATPEAMKLWSQSLGHEDVMTTFRSYGQVPVERQRQMLAQLRAERVGANGSN